MKKINPNLWQMFASNKGHANSKIRFLFIFLIVLLFYSAPLLASAGGADSTRLSDYLYLYTTISYTIIVLGITIFSGKGLDVFQDHFSLWTIALGCFLAASQAGKHDTVYKVFLVLLGLRLSIYILLNRKNLKIPDLKSILTGMLWSVATIITIAFILSFLHPTSEPLPSNLLVYIFDTFLYEVSFVTVIEESCFRGLLFALLIMNGYPEDRALIIQGILFWASHYLKIVADPVLFFIAVPILTLSTSLITKKYKLVYLAVIVHTFANVFGPILMAIL